LHLPLAQEAKAIVSHHSGVMQVHAFAGSHKGAKRCRTFLVGPFAFVSNPVTAQVRLRARWNAA